MRLVAIEAIRLVLKAKLALPSLDAVLRTAGKTVAVPGRISVGEWLTNWLDGNAYPNIEVIQYREGMSPLGSRRVCRLRVVRDSNLSPARRQLVQRRAHRQRSERAADVLMPNHETADAREGRRLSWIVGNMAVLIPQSYVALLLLHWADRGREDLLHVGTAIIIAIPSVLAMCISATALKGASTQVVKGFTWAMSLVFSVPLIMADSFPFGNTVVANGLVFSLLLPSIGGSQWGIPESLAKFALSLNRCKHSRLG